MAEDPGRLTSTFGSRFVKSRVTDIFDCYGTREVPGLGDWGLGMSAAPIGFWVWFRACTVVSVLLQMALLAAR